MREAIRRMVGSVTVEDAAVFLFGASFFIGVWYALPMVNTVTDVWAFSGGVLRSMEMHSLLPGYGVAYGTLSFYQNFVAMAVALIGALPFFHFDIMALKTALILNPSFTLLVPRIVSALTAIVFLYIVYRFLKHEVASAPWRFALLILSFGNVLATILARSGKMWMLSTALGIISFIYVYRAIKEEVPVKRPGMCSAIAIISAFLATANFAFAGLFLIAVPILFYAFSRNRGALTRLATFSIIGMVLFMAITALNVANVREQVSEFAAPFFGIESENRVMATLSPIEAFVISARHAIEAFPLLFIALAVALFYGMRNKALVVLSVGYAALYITAVSIVFRVDDGIALNVRHIFPIGFFLLFLLAAFRPPARIISYLLTGVGLAVYAYTVILLSIPTTYNMARDFIVAHYGNAPIRIDESVFELALPMNKGSYELHGTSSCGSACAHTRALSGDIAFRPVVVTHDADPEKVAQLPPPDLFISTSAIGCESIASFGNKVPDDVVFDIDINLGRMVMPEFYMLHALGKNLYLYDAHVCAPSAPYSVRQ